MTSKPRAAIYARLSAAQTGKADDEKSDSILNQVADLEALAKTHGYDILDTYTDDGVSGYSGKFRPQFQRLLSDIADRRLDIVLARHADRLERNEEEGTILRVASIRAGIRWQYASGQIVDPAAAEGGLIARVLSAISEFESQVKSERLRQHYQGRRLAGLLPAQKDCMGYAGFEVVEHEAARVREAFDMFTAEGSIRAIVTKWNGEGVPLKRGGAQGWSNAHVVGILRRPRYAGLVADRDGSIIEGLTGQWEPLVSVDQWMAVQAKLNNPERKTNAKGRTPLSLSAGLAQCAVCGFPLRTSTGKAWKTGEKYSILLCRNPNRGGVRHPSGNVADLDTLIRDAVVNAFAFGPSKLFEDDHDSAAVHDVYGKLADLREKRQKVVKLYEDRALEEFEVKERLAAYGQSIATLQDRLEALTSASAAAGMLVDLRAGFVDPETHRASFEGLAILRAALAEKFDALDILQRRRLVKALLRAEVSSGQGASKYLILHKVVRSLNDEDENEYLDSLSPIGSI